MKRVVGISEIVLWTGDKERALRFYRDLIGLEVISPPTLPKVFLRVGEGNAGIPQMIVLVPKKEAFEAQHAALVAAGYQPRDGKHPVLASRTMYVDDPDGNEVEFICRAPA